MITPDPNLAVEEVALPAYTDAPTPSGQAPWELWKRPGCLRWLWNLLSRLRERLFPDQPVEDVVEGAVKVLLQPPPNTYWYVTLFTPPAEVIEESRRALRRYQAKYREPDPDEWPYPWRFVMARHTGLPALMRGFLTEEDQFDAPDDVAGRAASNWLFEDLRARALFGIESSEAKERFREGDVYYGWYSARIPPIEASDLGTPPPDSLDTLSPSLRLGPQANGKTLVHVRYQQVHQGWPVFGGQVVVHMATADRRTCVSSSYFPLDDSISFSTNIGGESAIALAQQALAAYLDELEAVGLYWSLLSPWLEAQWLPGQSYEETWQPVYSYVSEELVRALVAFSQGHDHILSDLEGLAADGLLEGLLERMRALQDLKEKMEDSGLGKWDADADLFVLPFAGSYHLAYQVRLVPPDHSQAWRVFVDAETGEILGCPENLALHVKYYATAEQALAPPPTASKDLGEGSPCKEFMAVGIYQQHKPPEDDPAPSWIHNDTQGPDFEATNVAIHARKIYDHFVGACGADPNKLHSYKHNGQVIEPGMRARVAAPASGFSLNQVFNPFANPKLITLPTGILTSGDKQIHHLACDPEVVYHEVTHGLMWLLNHYPFDEIIQSVPFGRALVEGYANYFGRSLAWHSDPVSSLWARAAYRKEDESGNKVWDDEWALSRAKKVPGADLLPYPNLYPHLQTTGLPVYDVGMIWARALWDLHAILDAEQVDMLALAAYYFVNGWVANFELAAEGVLDAAEKAGVAGANQEALRQRFAERGIFAEQSIQALVHASNVPLSGGGQGTALLAGADAGLMRSTDNGQNWEDWDDLQGAGKLSGVVALALSGNTFYAAVEAKTSVDAPEVGIYQRASDGDGWSSVGEWPAGQTPQSLSVDDHRLYVGTGHGIWHWNFDDASASWAVFECPESSSGVSCTDCSEKDSCLFRWVGIDLSLASTSSGVDDLCVASFDAIRLRRVNPGAPWRRKLIGDTGDQAAITAVAAHSNFAYLGTLAHGIWWLEGASGDWARIDSQEELSSIAVLAMAAQENKLIAGTSAGVYMGTSPTNGNWTWEELINGLPQKAIATVVLPLGNQVLVSTARHGLWRWDGNQWQEVKGGVEKLVGKS